MTELDETRCHLLWAPVALPVALLGVAAAVVLDRLIPRRTP